jgi:hypothetical protein
MPTELLPHVTLFVVITPVKVTVAVPVQTPENVHVVPLPETLQLAFSFIDPIKQLTEAEVVPLTLPVQL